jgi:glucose/arabinose dehydrogenase
MTTTMTTTATATVTTATRAGATQPARAFAVRLLAGAWLLAAAMGGAQAQTAAAAAPALKAVVVAQGLANPWGLAFLPDGRMLVTERAGRLRIVSKDGNLSAPLAGLPAIAAGGQCGLLDVVADPQFSSNRRIFFSFAEPAPAGASGNSTAVGRARLVDDKLVDVQTIFVQQPKVASQAHCGSRIVFLRDGTLVVGLGDRFSRKDDAQNASNHLGKTVRITADGQPAPGNPLAATSGNAPEVWSIGHRNIQGMAVHPATGEVWAVEHGPQGGDELNLVEGGKNYGWPLVTYGRNYGIGTRIGEEGPKAGYEHPLKWWVPTSVAPAGLAFVTGDRYPGWAGSLLMGTLRGQALHRLRLNGRTVVDEDVLDIGIKERIRDVRQGPDGWLYVLTDSSEGRLLRLEPR